MTSRNALALSTIALLTFATGCPDDPDPAVVACEGREDFVPFCDGNSLQECQDGRLSSIIVICWDCTEVDGDVECSDVDEDDEFFAASVVWNQPGNAATDVPLDTLPAVEFDVPLRIDDGAFRVLANGSPVPGFLGVDPASGDDGYYSVWGYTPDAPLQPDTLYSVVIDAGLEMMPSALDQLGVGAGGTREEIRWTFTTVADNALSVVSTAPSSSGVPQDAAIEVTFSNVLDPTSVTATTVRLLDDGGQEVGHNRTVDGATLTIEPYSWLDPATDYTVSIGTGVLDVDGAGPESDISVSFSTLPALDWVSMTPADGATGVSIDTSLTLTFNVALDPATVTYTSIQPRASRLMMDQGSYNVPGNASASGTELTFVPTVGDWQEYETTYEIRLDTALRGINGEVLNFPDRPEFTTAFFDANRNYTVHTNGGGRSQSLDVTTDQFARAHFTSEVGTHPTSRWAFTHNVGDYWRMWNIQYGSSNVLAGREGTAAADLEFVATPPWPNTLWEFDSYGGHPGFVQGRGESPGVYYIKTNQWGDSRVLTISYDSGLGLSKASLASPTGSIHQLFWFKRRIQ